MVSWPNKSRIPAGIGAQGFVPSGRGNSLHLRPKRTDPQAVIRGELVGDDYATAGGIAVRSPSPILTLCRALIVAGQDPGTELALWRGGTLALRVRSIGEAAGLEVSGRGTGFIRRPDVRSAPPSGFSAGLGAKVAPTPNDRVRP
jgi:hypothetical protein